MLQQLQKETSRNTSQSARLITYLIINTCETAVQHLIEGQMCHWRGRNSRPQGASVPAVVLVRGPASAGHPWSTPWSTPCSIPPWKLPVVTSSVTSSVAVGACHNCRCCPLLPSLRPYCCGSCCCCCCCPQIPYHVEIVRGCVDNDSIGELQIAWK